MTDDNKEPKILMVDENGEPFGALAAPEGLFEMIEALRTERPGADLSGLHITLDDGGKIRPTIESLEAWLAFESERRTTRH